MTCKFVPERRRNLLFGPKTSGRGSSIIRYRATVESSASPAEVEKLLPETDAVAEVHNTIRAGVPVELLRG